jgi:hypothetical protein
LECYGRGIGTYLTTLLGLHEGAISESAVDAQIPLPKDEAQRYDALTNEYGIDRTALQLSFVLQSNIYDKLYELENWRMVMDQLAVLLYRQYPAMKVQYNVFSGPARFMGFENADIEAMIWKGFSERSPNVRHALIQKPLDDVAILLKHQALTVGTDTGLLHMPHMSLEVVMR